MTGFQNYHAPLSIHVSEDEIDALFTGRTMRTTSDGQMYDLYALSTDSAHIDSESLVESFINVPFLYSPAGL